LMRVGAYQKGSDLLLDQALLLLPELNRFLEQRSDETVTLQDTVGRLLAIPT
jgi:flagellum-specific ATP synthase